MKATDKRQAASRSWYWLTGGVWLVYALAGNLAPVTANPYHLTPQALFLVRLSVQIPILLIWLAAVYGLLKIKAYARSVTTTTTTTSTTTTDGQAVDTIANGLGFLTASVIIPATVNAFKPYFPKVAALAVTSNYLTVALQLAAFTLVFWGSSMLVEIARSAGVALRRQPWVLASVIFLGGWYSSLVRNIPNLATNYHLTPRQYIFTLVLPYILVWMLGLLSVLNLSIYAKTVAGTIYRQALTRLIQGITTVVVFSVALQFLTTAGSAFAKWGLGAILLLVYIIIAFWAVGYLLIATGARKLGEIEEAL